MSLSMYSEALKSDLKILHEPTIEKNCTDLVLNLEAEMCACSDIVGNKARSLFRLKKAIANSLIINVSITHRDVLFIYLIY